MTAPLIEIETQDFVSAARRLELWAAEPLTRAVGALCDTLGGCAAMSGNDPGGMAWAERYDPAARSATCAAQDAINAVHKLAAMFEQTARNYAAADAASTAGVRRSIDAATATLPCVGSYALPTCLPSAAGGSGGTPHGWNLVATAVGRMWPNGHQDRLRAAAQRWRASGAAFADAAGQVIDASGLAVADRLPEADDMWLVCTGLAGQLRRVGQVHAALASACDGLAEHLDDAHSAVVRELTELVASSAAIEEGSALLSVVSFGMSEVGGQALEAGRVAAAAARVAAIIERFTSLARQLAATVAELAERADRVAGSMAGLLDVQLSTAVLEQVRTAPSALRVQEMLAVRRLGTLGGNFPSLALTTGQLEKKFKHAEVLGISTPRGRDGFQAFDATVRRFLERRATRRVIGMYRGGPTILSYQIKSRLVVIQRLDGTFVSAWRATRKQMWHLVRERRFGGG